MPLIPCPPRSLLVMLLALALVATACVGERPSFIDEPTTSAPSVTVEP